MSPLLIIGIVVGVIIVLILIGLAIWYFVFRNRSGTESVPVVGSQPSRKPVGQDVVLTPANQFGTTDLLEVNTAVETQMRKLSRSNVFPITLVEPIESYVEALKNAIVEASQGTVEQKQIYEQNRLRVVSAVAYLQNIVRQITNRNKEAEAGASPQLLNSYDDTIAQTLRDYFAALRA